MFENVTHFFLGGTTDSDMFTITHGTTGYAELFKMNGEVFCFREDLPFIEYMSKNSHLTHNGLNLIDGRTFDVANHIGNDKIDFPWLDLDEERDREVLELYKEYRFLSNTIEVYTSRNLYCGADYDLDFIKERLKKNDEELEEYSTNKTTPKTLSMHTIKILDNIYSSIAMDKKARAVTKIMTLEKVSYREAIMLVDSYLGL